MTPNSQRLMNVGSDFPRADDKSTMSGARRIIL
jgi:hypothetical protein